jgi:hypothetical protein
MHCCHATYILKAPRDKALQQQAVVDVLGVSCFGFACCQHSVVGGSDVDWEEGREGNQRGGEMGD